MGEYYYGYGFSNTTQRKQELERKKKSEAALLEALKQDQRQEIISTIQPTISCINGTIDDIKDELKYVYDDFNNRIHQLEDNDLHERICQLEKTAAVRSGLSGRPHRKLTIKVYA
jgi:hypothetical protein